MFRSKFQRIKLNLKKGKETFSQICEIVEASRIICFGKFCLEFLKWSGKNVLKIGFMQMTSKNIERILNEVCRANNTSQSRISALLRLFNHSALLFCVSLTLSILKQYVYTDIYGNGFRRSQIFHLFLVSFTVTHYCLDCDRIVPTHFGPSGKPVKYAQLFAYSFFFENSTSFESCFYPEGLAEVVLGQTFRKK